ncbi:MAG: phosphate ABC transporter substrate-binding protein PstS [Candidatus Thermoplasmatota archaeon]|nr:phosphate ABC transporter substrate-binding protein PstS [Candidatus Thermoplasmatota archaeon]
MNRSTIAIIAVVVVVIVVVGGVAAVVLYGHHNQQPAKVTLSESGSSLLYPVFNAWSGNYTNATITTLSTGSGTGISSAIAGTVVIGASDAYMPYSDAQKYPYVENIPIAISYQYITYNIPGVSASLKLNGSIIAGIFMGTITNWDSPAIAALNPGVTLPNHTIIPVHRSDGSGDTFMFTSFLSKSNATWAKQVGAATSVNWPSVQAAQTGAQNAGIISTMSSTPYSIGYIAATYQAQVQSAKFGVALLENQVGQFVAPTVANVSTAASQYLTEIPANGTVALQYAPGSNSYPIADMEYIVVKQNQTSASIANALKAFITWAVSPNGGSADKYLSTFNLVALPSNVVQKIINPLIAQISTTVSGATLVTLSESGSSLLYPVFNSWAKNYTNSTITTLSTGSGTGISSAIAGTVVIGASDAYMPYSDASKYPYVQNIPIAISYQYIAYNIPGVTATLKLNGNVIAGIFMGTITNWNNSAIAALNPGVSLPNHTIVPVHRSDGSGDTFMFTSFLSLSNSTWAKSVSYGTSVNWPSVAAAETGAQNAGIISTMTSTPYSIGYIAATYQAQVQSAKFGVALLENQVGQFVAPTVQNVSNAASQYLSEIPANGTVRLQYAPGDNSYPIADMEYIIVKQNQTNQATATALQAFIKWAVSESGGSASNYLSQYNLVPLPSNVISKIVIPLVDQISTSVSSNQLVTLSESGSSLLYPVFNSWAANYSGATITTLSTGSGTGISSAIAGTVVIGASDAYMPYSDAQKYPYVENIPIMISYQYIAYNIPGVNATLDLNGNVIAGIYMGTITNWDSPAIAALNPGVTLPNHTIIPVHRSDGSGDTFMFTSFLSLSNSTWNSRVSYGTAVNWPSVPSAETGAQNAGIISTMSSTPYSIGYIAATYEAQVHSAGFGVANLQDQNGQFVGPTVQNVSNAASHYLSQIPANGTVRLQYAPGNESYPIADMEYIVVKTNQTSPAIASALQAFIKFAVSGSGGAAANYLSGFNLVALPSSVVTQIVYPLVNKITG